MKSTLALLMSALLMSVTALQAEGDKISVSLMSEAEQKAAGIDKLSPEEKHALDQWLAHTVIKKPAPPITQKNKIMHGDFAIKSTQDLGRYIMLENGLTYEIPSRSRKKTMAWRVGEKVRLTEPVRPVNFKLENIQQDQVVGGKVVANPPAPKVAKTEAPKASDDAQKSDADAKKE